MMANEDQNSLMPFDNVPINLDIWSMFNVCGTAKCGNDAKCKKQR